MISTLLDKIGNLFDKDFLFGSFLPTLIFFAMIVMTLAMVVGLDGTWSWLGWLSSLEQVTLAAGTSVGVVVFAYVMNSLRPVLLALWCGKSGNWLYWPMYRLGERYWQWQYKKLDVASEPRLVWTSIQTYQRDLIGAIRKKEPRPTGICPPEHITKLTDQALQLRNDPTPETALKLIDRLADAYSRFKNDSLREAYHAVDREIGALRDQEDQRHKTALATRVNEFGPPGSLRATSLGNLIEAFQHYSMRRYQMEAEIYWPRLLRVVDEKYLAIAEDPRIIMEFSIALATLFIWYAFLVFFLGPWLWSNLYVWGSLGMVSLVGSYFFYGRAHTAARQYSQFNAACFDLFRLNLLDALHARPPATWADERGTWNAISQLMVYGNTSRPDFPLVTPPIKTEAQQ